MPFSFSLRAFFFAFAAFLPMTASAIPGPLISWGAGLVSNAAAIFALVAGFLAVAVGAASLHVRIFVLKRPKIAVAAGVLIIVAVAAAIFSAMRDEPLESPFDQLRITLAERAEKSVGEDSEIPLSTLLNVLEIPRIEKRVTDIKLEEEIAYSIGRNNNVIWNRYLSAGKVPTDQSTLDAIASGTYEIRFEELFENGRISPKFSVIDLRTPLEFATSAHFKNSKNVEYRTIVNDEAAFEKGISYVFICHDGAADLSRSLIATAYLRSKGYSAYALKTGMNPILKRLWIPPVSYESTTPYEIFTASKNSGGGIFVDPLWALSETLAKRGYPAGYSVMSFPFYRMDAETHEGEMEKIRNLLQKGETVNFACYDTFSCFYSRIFVGTLGNERTKLAIFR